MTEIVMRRMNISQSLAILEDVNMHQKMCYLNTLHFKKEITQMHTNMVNYYGWIKAEKDFILSHELVYVGIVVDIARRATTLPDISDDARKTIALEGNNTTSHMITVYFEGQHYFFRCFITR